VTVVSLRSALTGLLLFVVAACTSVPPAPENAPEKASEPTPSEYSEKGQDVAIFAIGLIDTGYRFGGKNPEAGLDCSGMVSYIYNKSAGVKLVGSARDMARKGHTVERGRLRPGDLVFFNTRNAPFSHVGIYIGDDRFVHAPSTNGRVRIDPLSATYYTKRYETARRYFD